MLRTTFFAATSLLLASTHVSAQDHFIPLRPAIQPGEAISLSAQEDHTGGVSNVARAQAPGTNTSARAIELGNDFFGGRDDIPGPGRAISDAAQERGGINMGDFARSQSPGLERAGQVTNLPSQALASPNRGGGFSGGAGLPAQASGAGFGGGGNDGSGQSSQGGRSNGYPAAASSGRGRSPH
jgi:hypothetical protein